MSGLMDGSAEAISGLRAQALRLRLTAENIANADTPGYRRKLTSFHQQIEAGRATGQVETGPIRLDRAPVEQRYDPGHPLADAHGLVSGSNVNMGIELADAREAQRSYEANLRMFDQLRQMSRDLLGLLKR